MKNKKIINRAWLFDVDGVITDPQAKQVINPRVIEVISARIKKGEPTSLVTGRSIDWLEERVLHFFEQNAKDYLQNFFVSAEKGGVWGSYDTENNLRIEVDENLIVPEPARSEIAKVVDKFPDVLFYDSPKKTMESIEVIDGVAVEKFKEIQPQADRMILEILKKHHLEKEFRVDSVRISTDIENIKAGKNLGARRFLDWLNQKNITPKKFYAFGDSVSDAEMAQELYDQGLDVTFVFAGGREMIKEKYPFPVVFPKSLFDRGVVEFLSTT